MEKLKDLKHKKPYNNTVEIDENLELFKNEFRKNYNYIQTGSDKDKDKDKYYTNPTIPTNPNEKSNEYLLTDEKLSEFNDKF